MTKGIWNPELPGAAATLEFLNRAFGGGWNESLYRWYLTRPFNGRNPDRIVISDEGQPLAGSVVNYRQLETEDGRVRDVGIATGSWTLPEARGRGLFTQMMQASVARAGERGCQYLLAFVTEDNASRSALERCGAAMIPATYLLADGDAVVADSNVAIDIVDVSAKTLHDAARPGNAVRFHYASAESWASQHLERPLPVEVCRLHGEYAIVEKTPDTDRLQWTSAGPRNREHVATSLALRAAGSGRRFFTYATTGRFTADGLVARPGFVCCLPTPSGHPDPLDDLGATWDIQSGDRL